MTLSWKAPQDAAIVPRRDQAAHTAVVDPYYVWATLTGWRGYMAYAGQRSDAKADPPLEVMLLCAVQDVQLIRQLSDDKVLQIGEIYRRDIPGGTGPTRHFTARIPRSQLAAFVAAPPKGLRWQLAQPLRDAERVARGSAMGEYGPSRNKVDFRAPQRLKAVVSDALRQPAPARPAQVIGVIDFGCPFLNVCFADAQAAPVPGERNDPSAPRSRIHALWDQGSEPRAASAWPWRPTDSLGYGRQLNAPVINALYAAVHPHGRPTPPDEDEASVYRGIDYLIDYDDARRRLWHATHGAHVLDLAAGSLDPLTGERDLASESRIIFVQLPSLTAADSSGASLGAHVLDGVRYILDMASPEAKVVINLSYGALAGSHDGRSLIEQALDEILEQRAANLAIVLAAGNSRERRQHACRVARNERSAFFRLEMATGDTTDTFVEAWYAPPPAGWSLAFRVRGPDRVWTDWVAPGRQTCMVDTGNDNQVVALLRHDTLAPDARLQRCLLALAPTAQPPNLATSLAPAGAWDIEAELRRTPVEGRHPPCDGITIDVWIQRDEPGDNAEAGESILVNQDLGDDHSTLSNLATGKRTVVVGGFRRSDGDPAPYSSIGPRAQGLPMMLAACEEDAVHPSIRATAVRSGESFRMNGTSVAAPVLSRRLYEALVRKDGTIAGLQGWRALLKGLARTHPSTVRVADPAPLDRAESK